MFFMPKKNIKENNAEIVVELDEKDIQILKLLQHNAKITVKEIADSIHLSTTPVHERIKRLEQSGIIKQYVTILNNKLIQKGLIVICYVSLKQHNKEAGKKFIDSILKMDEIIECYNISGEFDFMLKVVSKDMDDYYNFHVNKLSQAENIGNVQSVFVMGIVKEKQITVD